MQPLANQPAIHVPLSTKETLRSLFVTQWEHERLQNKKQHFCNSIKNSFGCDKYLGFELNQQQSKIIAQIRTSSHRFNIETGRHGHAKQSMVLNHVCHHCCDIENLSYLTECQWAPVPWLQPHVPIIEDEIHVLQMCPRYDDLRNLMSDQAKACLSDSLGRLLTERDLTLQLAKLLVNINQRRFPTKNRKSEDTPTRDI